MCFPSFFVSLDYMGDWHSLDPKECDHPEQHLRKWCDYCQVHKIDEIQVECQLCGKIVYAEPTKYWKKRGWDKKRLRH